jgi:hypothetical protein
LKRRNSTGTGSADEQALALAPKQGPKDRLAGVAAGFTFLGHAAAGLGELGFLLGAEALHGAGALLLRAAAAGLGLLMPVALGLAVALLGAALLALPLPRLLLPPAA